MEFWPENQSQSALYAKFGSIPGRNFSHNFHDRHQAAHYPLYYSPRGHSRESSYWTGPGSRTEGALEEYSTWMDPELSAPASSHFPFILDRGEYQQARDREWTAAQRTARDYDRGLVREAWQRRWEPCGPARYNRELSAKRSDSSYRELEAWAARYCHSLPRRRRLEAESRGASQGLLDSGRAADGDPRAAALQQLRQPVREPAAWDAGGRLQAPTYHQSQATSPDTSCTLDIREKTSNRRRPLSQPPGYTAPPPYDSPTNPYATSWEQGGKRQSYCPQATLTQDEELQHERKGEKEHFTEPDQSKTCTEPDGGRETASQDVQAATTLQESEFSLQQQQTQKPTSSKIIEGRKFRLSKKTGGLTVFCLVSRTAGVAETPSLPLCISHRNVQSVALGDVATVPQETNHSRSEQADTPAERPLDVLSNAETGSVGPQRKTLAEASPTFGRESKQPASVRYPLWREPGFTSRAEASSTSHLKVHSEDRSEPLSQEQRAPHPHQPEAGRPETRGPESEGSKGLWVIDTSCVVVKMERIPSPNKGRVHYVARTEHGANAPVATDHSTETSLKTADPRPPSSGDVSSLCRAAPASETLEERAERILGIPLYESITEPPPGEERDEDADLPDAGLIPDEQKDFQEEAVCPNDEDQGTNEDGKDFAGSQDQTCNVCEEDEIDCQLETNLNTSEETEMIQSTRGGEKPEQSPLADDDPSPQSSLTALSCVSESNEDDCEWAENRAAHPEQTTFPHTLWEQPALPPGSAGPSPASSPGTDQSPSLPAPPLHLLDQSLMITLCNHEDEPSHLLESQVNITLENFGTDTMAEQPGDEQLDDREEGKTSGEQQDPKHALDQTHETPTENIQSPTEMKTDGNNRTDSESATEDGGKERTQEADAAAGRLAQNATEPQAEASDAGCDASRPPADALSRCELPSTSRRSHQTDPEPGSLNPDTAVPGSVPAPDWDQIREFSSSFLPESPSDLPPQQEGESVFLDLPQCPTSLWDAVNRIRKHTAPDSENEEEEASELWDPESSGQGPACDQTEDSTSRKMGFEEASGEGSVEDACHEDDTVSCSSASSHDSGDTVIVAEEDKVQETTPDAGTESETDEEPHAAEGESQDETEEDEEEQQDVSS